MHYFEAISEDLYMQYHAAISPITLGTCTIFEHHNKGRLCEFWIFSTASVYCIFYILVCVLLSLSCLIHFYQIILGHHHAKSK